MHCTTVRLRINTIGVYRDEDESHSRETSAWADAIYADRGRVKTKGSTGAVSAPRLVICILQLRLGSSIWLRWTEQAASHSGFSVSFLRLSERVKAVSCQTWKTWKTLATISQKYGTPNNWTPAKQRSKGLQRWSSFVRVASGNRCNAGGGQRLRMRDGPCW